jgi:hypothetical protein
MGYTQMSNPQQSMLLLRRVSEMPAYFLSYKIKKRKEEIK